VKDKKKKSEHLMKKIEMNGVDKLT